MQQTAAQSPLRRAPAQPNNLLEPLRRNIQCPNILYPYIECTSFRCSLHAFLATRAIHVRFTHIACRILVKIVCRARPWRVSVLIQLRPLLPCGSFLPSGSSETEWLSSFTRTMPCG